jgi:hypothetical protein
MGVRVGTLAVMTKAENVGHDHAYSHAWRILQKAIVKEKPP